MGAGSGLGALLGHVLAVAGPVDVDAQSVHGQAVEDGHGNGGVAEVTPPVAEGDIGGDGGGEPAMAAVDEIEEGVSGGGLIVPLSHLAEPDIVDDEQVRARPGLEAAGVRRIGEAGVQVVEEVDAPGIPDRELLLAGAKSEGLEQVALAGAALAGDHEVVVASHEVEAAKLPEEGLVEPGLEVPVESFEGLALVQAAGVDASTDAGLQLRGDLDAQDVLEQSGGARALAQGPGEQVVELAEGMGQSEEEAVLPESLDDGVGAGRGAGVSAARVSFGHGSVS